MRTPLLSVPFVFTLALALVSCGGGVSAEPLLGGTVMGSYNGSSFTAVNGYATVSDDTNVILM